MTIILSLLLICCSFYIMVQYCKYRNIHLTLLASSSIDNVTGNQFHAYARLISLSKHQFICITYYARLSHLVVVLSWIYVGIHYMPLSNINLIRFESILALGIASVITTIIDTFSWKEIPIFPNNTENK